jgi:phenylacetate-coenzyme A ligase PaaK-like adenylate-forming protein
VLARHEQGAQGNFQVFSDLVKLESIAVEGEQRLLVTSLSNRVMPIIRYELGDLGRHCSDGCGQTWVCEMRVQVEGVDSIPRSRPGKHRFVMGLPAE